MPISDPAPILPHAVSPPADAGRPNGVVRGSPAAVRRLDALGRAAAAEAGALRQDLAGVRATRVAARRAAQAAAGGPLGIPADLPTTSPPVSVANTGEGGGKSGATEGAAAERRRREAPDRLRRRYELQDLARAILSGGPGPSRPRASTALPAGQLVARPGRRGYRGRPQAGPRLHRIHHCQQTPVGGLVALNYHPDHGSASYGGLQTCGSMWACPVCAAKIGARRAEEVTQGAANWLAMGNHIYMLTLTLRHNAGLALYQSLDAIKEAYKQTTEGRAWTLFKRRIGLMGNIVAREITHGAAGWHPHLHILLFTTEDMGKQRFVNEQWLARRWQTMLRKLGFDADLEHGCDLRAADEGAGPYVAKLAGAWSLPAEVAGGLHKLGRGTSRTMPQLLADSGRARQLGREAAAQAGALYAEMVAATPRTSWLKWSKNLRALVGLGAEETDEEVAAEQTAEAENLMVLTREQWRWVRGNELRGELLARACGGDAEYVAGWLMLQGLAIDKSQLRYNPLPDEKPPKKP